MIVHGRTTGRYAAPVEGMSVNFTPAKLVAFATIIKGTVFSLACQELITAVKGACPAVYPVLRNRVYEDIHKLVFAAFDQVRRTRLKRHLPAIRADREIHIVPIGLYTRYNI